MAETFHDVDKFFRILSRRQVSAIAKHDQLRIGNRIAQSKGIVEGKVIVVITPHDHRRLPNQ